MTRLLTAAAFAALIAGPVAAQDAGGSQQPTLSSQPAQNGAPSTAGAASDVDTTNAMNGSTNSQASAAATTGASPGTSASTNTGMSASSNTGMSGGMASMGAQVQVTAMAPIPDTPENRARYGQPESRAGRMKLGEGPVQSLPTASRALANARTSAQAE